MDICQIPPIFAVPDDVGAPNRRSRSEEKLRALKARLEKEVDPTATGLPTIVAESFDGESLDRMVAQAKVGDD